VAQVNRPLTRMLKVSSRKENGCLRGESVGIGGFERNQNIRV